MIHHYFILFSAFLVEHLVRCYKVISHNIGFKFIIIVH